MQEIYVATILLLVLSFVVFGIIYIEAKKEKKIKTINLRNKGEK